MKIAYRYLRLAALLLATVTAFSLTGCQLENTSPDAGFLRETFMTIQATYENPDVEALDARTKTVLHDDGHVYWSPNDSISLFYGSGVEGGSKFIAQNTSEVRVTNFSGKIGVVTGGDEITEDETYFWGLYPYDAASSCDGQTVTMQIAPEQKGAASTFSSGYAPSLGRAKGLMLSFKNIYSGLIFSVKKPGFRSLTLTTNNGVLIAGKAKVGIGSDNNPVVRDVIEGTNSVTVYAPTPEGFEVGKNYYMILFPFTGGFTLRLNSATQTGVFSFTGSMTFARNKLNTAAGVDDYCQFETTITRASFTDEHFANYIFGNSGIDQDGDGVLSEVEMNSVNRISVCTDTISSMQGIEFFPNLVLLDCGGTRSWNEQTGQDENNGLLTSLDLSGNPALGFLSCGANLFSALDVSQNPSLIALECPYNQLTFLDVSHNLNLLYLDCGGNILSALNVSQNLSLEDLYCGYQQIESLDISHNSALKTLHCPYNWLTTLDVSHNPDMNFLDCGGNLIQSLNLFGNPELTTLYAGQNLIASLDVSKNLKLKTLYCNDNLLGGLDVSNNLQLETLGCNGDYYLLYIMMMPDQTIPELYKPDQTLIIRKGAQDSQAESFGLGSFGNWD